jgi:hypothetical protein
MAHVNHYSAHIKARRESHIWGRRKMVNTNHGDTKIENGATYRFNARRNEWSELTHHTYIGGTLAECITPGCGVGMAQVRRWGELGAAVIEYSDHSH